ncbi:MAG: uroporphyrinogen decarboxylase family protein [Bryobacterales bacterium]|nr:uroporphyrinogen decarboxylase family protein [Bryobacterales bacterium]
MNSRERVFALLAGQPVDRLPLMPMTMMFAADQTGVPYGRYALEHDLLVQAQLATAERFAFDHVSTITETREARDCGATIRYFENQPYAIDESQARLSEKSELRGMVCPDPESAPAMRDRLQAIRQLKQAVGTSKVIEGWVEGPCGAAADLRGINTLMLDFHDDPAFVRDLFDFVLELGLRFARAQVEAGADLIGVGDPATSLTGPRIYRDLIWHWHKRLVDGLHAMGAKMRLHICGNTRTILGDIALLGVDILDVDSAVSMADARARTGANQVLLGGIDPVRVLLNGTPAEVEAAVLRCRAEAGARYIVGAGCEVPRGTPPENMAVLRQCTGHLPAQPLSL